MVSGVCVCAHTLSVGAPDHKRLWFLNPEELQFGQKSMVIAPLGRQCIRQPRTDLSIREIGSAFSFCCKRRQRNHPIWVVSLDGAHSGTGKGPGETRCGPPWCGRPEDWCSRWRISYCPVPSTLHREGILVNRLMIPPRLLSGLVHHAVQIKVDGVGRGHVGQSLWRMRVQDQ
jgi:hypothetical protein